MDSNNCGSCGRICSTGQFCSDFVCMNQQPPADAGSGSDAGGTCAAPMLMCDGKCTDVRLDLQIVAPSLVRDVRDVSLLSSWRSALAWMRSAARWVIVGYSLPPEDLAIRSLLLRAYTTAVEPPEVVVVQNGDKARPNYELLFPGCDYRNDGLEEFLQR